MPYIPKKHEEYDLLPFCRNNGGEVFEYPSELISKAEKLINPTEADLWKILDDPTGMAYNTIYGNGKGKLSTAEHSEIIAQLISTPNQ